MMELQQLIQKAAQDPSFQQALQVAQTELSDASPDQIEELIGLFETMLQRPEEYQNILEAAIKDDMIEAGDMPDQYDATIIASALVVLYKLREGGGQAQMFARGGLAGMRTLSRQGRLGDTMMAHISPEEAAMLKARGGAGTINPQTGYPQYFSLKKLFRAIIPIALNFIAPGLGAAIGGAIGLSGAAAAAVGGALIGGASSALTGGNALQGALMGGLGGGLGGMAGGFANKALGLNLGQAGQSILGSGLIGGVAGAATGQGFLKGAGQGVLGGAIGQIAGTGGNTAFSQGISSAANTFGQGLTAGYDPKEAATMGALSGLATGLTFKPSNAAVDARINGETAEVKLPDGSVTSNVPGTTGMNAQGQTGTYVINPQTGASEFKVNPGSYQYNPQTKAVEWQATQPNWWQKLTGAGGAGGAGGGGILSNLTPTKVGLGLAALSALSPSPEVQQAVGSLSPEQQEYFNRPNVAWDWDLLQKDANKNGMSLSEYMASNWNQVTSGQYNAAAPAPAMAHGGVLNVMARFAKGSGSGRDDTIDARLSDGEYVMDAETVAMLGDGSSDEGARRLDKMRNELRQHKGKALAKGKFSPNAKSPLTYLKGAA
jgi:hypothetical protein